MLTIERKNLILKIVEENQSATVGQLTEKLNVSEVTVRKMLNSLAGQGLLRRTRGGALSLSVPVRENDLRAKEKTNTRQKKDIALKALEFVADHDTLYLDAGTTTLELARLLRNETFRNLTVITNALHIAAELTDSPELEVILTGGLIRSGVGSCVGPLAERAVADLHFDKAFLGGNHLAPGRGVFTPNLMEAQIKRSAALAADRAFLLCDSSKFSGGAMSKIADLEIFEAIITDDGLEESLKERFIRAGHNLITAGGRKR